MPRQVINISQRCFNDAFIPYLNDTTTNQFIYGGAGSGKSMFLARRAVIDVAKHDRNYLIARGTQRSIRGSTWNEIIDAIRFLGLGPYFTPSKAELTITCIYNDRQFVFVGCDDTEKIKSIRPKTGVFTDLWQEEATEISAPANRQLRLRLRGRSRLKKRYIYSFNPIYRTHHLFQTYFAPHGIRDDVREFRDGDELLIHRSTYRDNRFLDQSDIDELLSLKAGDPYYYGVYAEGHWGVLGDTIIRDWEIANLSEQYGQVADFRNGLDFGYSNDPTALAHSSLDPTDSHVLRVHTPPLGELYATGYDNVDLAPELLARIGEDLVWCDESDPRSIAELNRFGVNAKPAKKPPGSVMHGIQWLQQHHIVVDEQSQGAINELSLYAWLKDKNGLAYNKPQDTNNHFIDALRYAWEKDMRQKRPLLVVSGTAADAVQQRREEKRQMVEPW